MRIEHISFSGQGPLSGFTASFKPLTLIIGDNERGKSLILDALAEALFDKTPPQMKFTGRSFASRGDAYRLRNILYFSGSNLRGVSNWDEELRSLLYGHDLISQNMHKNFVKTMGGQSLDALHRALIDFKQPLNEALADSAIEDTKDTELENKLQRIQQEKNDLFPLMVKMRYGQEYLDLLQCYRDAQNSLEENNKKRPDPAEAEALGKETAVLEAHIRKKRSRLEAWEKGAPLSPWERIHLFSGNLISFVFGCIALGGSFIMVWFGQHMPHTHPLKLGALALFITAAVLLLKTVFSEMHRSVDTIEPYDAGKARFMEKEHARLVSLEEQLYAKRGAYRKKIEALRRNAAQDESPKNSQILEEISKLLDAQEEKILSLYQSLDPSLVQEEVASGEERLRRANLLEYYRENPKPLSTPEGKVYGKAFASALKNLQSIAKDSPIGNRYPEILSWTEDAGLGSLGGIAAELDLLLDKIAKDRDKAEKLVKAYQELRAGGEEILFRVFQSGDFRKLVQWLFGGKYKSFDLGTDPKGRFQVRARTGKDELIPVEELSEAASLQFYFAVKLALAQEILDDEEGVILLDESLSLFDTLRTRQFIDILKVFAEGGWQIVYAMKDDKLVYDSFNEKFSGAALINLNEGLH